MKTTAEEYYQALGRIAGSLFYLKRKQGSTTEFVFESVMIDTKDRDLTIKILQRTMEQPDFIAFPGTPEMATFVNEAVVQ